MKNKIIKLDLKDTENPLASYLHPDFSYKFMTFFGNVYSMGVVMRFIAFEKYDSNWLGRKATSQEMSIIKKGGNRDVPNYWGLIKLLMVDRFLSDKKFINTIMTTPDITTVNFQSHIQINSGLLESRTVENKKLIVYCKFIKEIINLIYIKFSQDENFIKAGTIDNLSKEDYKKIKTDIKRKIFSKVLEFRKGDKNLLYPLLDSTDEELKKVYMR